MLAMNHVTKSFGNFKALDDLTMNVPKGCIYGLVGPNGAGKSTAIRHLVGVYRPDAGSVTMEGSPIDENVVLKERIGYIADDVFYFPSASLEEMRRHYRELYPHFDDELFQRLYDVFRLPGKSPLRRMSKGMQKQAAFQLTVSIRPGVMILDEPLDGLDPVMRRQVLNLILDDVAQRGVTVLVSSHNLRELEDICDHVGIMDHGKMLMERSLADLQGNTVKLQMVGQAPEGLDILHHSVSGRLNTYIVRGKPHQVERLVGQTDCAYFDVLPLSLEELFIYELGGVDYEVKSVIL